jgi:hypothetical protein
MSDPETPDAGEDTAEHPVAAELAERLDPDVAPRDVPEAGEPSHDDGGRLREWLAEHDRPILERYDAERVEVEAPAESEGGEVA